MAILPVWLPIMDAVPVVALFALVVTIALACQLSGALQNPKVTSTLPTLVAGSVLGVPLGVAALTSIDPRVLKIALGCCMLIFVVERVIHDVHSRGFHVAPHALSVRFSPIVAAESDRGSDAGDRRDVAELEMGGSGCDESMAALPSAALPDDGTLPTKELLSAEAHAAAHGNANGEADLSGSGRQLLDEPWLGFVVGVVAGVLGGALNEAGPPVVIFITLKGWSNDDTKATLQFYFLAISVIAVTTHTYRGLIAARHLYYLAIGIPAAGLGVTLGVLLYNRMDHLLFARLVTLAMLVTGSVYIYTSVAELRAEDPATSHLRRLASSAEFHYGSGAMLETLLTVVRI